MSDNEATAEATKEQQPPAEEQTVELTSTEPEKTAEGDSTPEASKEDEPMTLNTEEETKPEQA